MTTDPLVGLLIGGISGAVIAEALDRDRLWRQRATRWWRSVWYTPEEHQPSYDHLSIENLRTNWISIDGDGEAVYLSGNLSCSVLDGSLDLPDEIRQRREAIFEREESLRKSDRQYHENGPLYALDGYELGRTVHRKMTLHLRLRETDYYTFQATVVTLATQPLLGEPLRQRYLADEVEASRHPVPFLATGFGVALVIFTKNRDLVMTRRSQQVGARKGQIDVSVVEGVHPIFDRASNEVVLPDFYRCAVRGAKEELGISLTEKDIHFLGFGVDMEYYQWNLIAYAEIDQTFDQIESARNRAASGKWETRDIFRLPGKPELAFRDLKHEKMWSVGWVAVYWSLVKIQGRTKVDDAARKVLT